MNFYSALSFLMVLIFSSCVFADEVLPETKTSTSTSDDIEAEVNEVVAYGRMLGYKDALAQISKEAQHSLESLALERRAGKVKPMRFGKRGNVRPMRFGKREAVRPMRFGKRDYSERPFIQYGKRASNVRPMRFGKRDKVRPMRFGKRSNDE